MVRDDPTKASITWHGEVGEATPWLPALIADATATNAWPERPWASVEIVDKLWTECFDEVTSDPTGGAAWLAQNWTAVPANVIGSHSVIELVVVPVLNVEAERFGAIVECKPSRAASYKTFEQARRLSIAWLLATIGIAAVSEAREAHKYYARAYRDIAAEDRGITRGEGPFSALVMANARSAIQRSVEAPVEATDPPVEDRFAAQASDEADVGRRGSSRYCVECGEALLRPGGQKFCASCGAPIGD